MKSKFITLVDYTYGMLTEAEMPPTGGAPAGGAPTGGMPPTADAGASALPGAGGGMPGGAGGMSGDAAGGQGTDAAEKMDNKAKKDADPIAYTQSILSLLVDKQEGVSPEMFNAFVDNVSFSASKIKDKEGLKRFYKPFYDRVQLMLQTREELKEMYKQLQSTVGDLMSQPEEPNTGQGGAGMSGPSGPGVK